MTVEATIVNGVALGAGYLELEFVWKGELVRVWVSDDTEIGEVTFESRNLVDQQDTLAEWDADGLESSDHINLLDITVKATERLVHCEGFTSEGDTLTLEWM